MHQFAAGCIILQQFFICYYARIRAANEVSGVRVDILAAFYIGRTAIPLTPCAALIALIPSRIQNSYRDFSTHFIIQYKYLLTFFTFLENPRVHCRHGINPV